MLSTLVHLRAAGFEMAALAPAGDLSDALAAKQVEVVPFLVRDGANVRRPQELLRAEIRSILRSRRPDLLHANSLAMGRLSGPVAAECQVPSMAHLRDIIRLSATNVADLNRHSRLLAVSAATRAAHVAQGLATEKTFVLHNGVDLEVFRPASRTGWLHRDLGLKPERDLLVGSVGQLVMRKGQDVLARAAVSLAERFPHAHYVFVGSRYSEKEEALRFEAGLHEAFAAAGMSDRAHFLGTREDIAQLLPELHVLAHTARQEPLGRVLLEAAACGLAVVATDVGGTREVFPASNESALIVPADDVSALAAALDQLLADVELRQKLGAAARRRVEEAFAVERAAGALAEHYRTVLAGV